jgi:hypothetical protein
MKKISKPIAFLALSAFFVVPAFAAAQGGINMSAITGYSNGIIDVINKILVPILMAIAFIVFLWGVYKYFIYGADSDAERATGKQFVLWGVIGFAVIFSVWGLVNVVRSVFGMQGEISAPPPPTFNPPSGTSAPSSAAWTPT